MHRCLSSSAQCGIISLLALKLTEQAWKDIYYSIIVLKIVCFSLVSTPTCHHPPPVYFSLSDESHTPTFTHVLFAFLNELIVVVDCSTCYRAAWSAPSWLFIWNLTLYFFLAFSLFLFIHSSLFSPTPCFHQCCCFLLPLFSSLCVCACFVPCSQRECVTAAALPVQADSDWFSGASHPGPHRPEGA